LEYDVIGVEEATTLSHRKYKDIQTCCRTSKRNFRPRIYSTANPGGVGHAWYRTRFIQPHHAKAETETRFIPATVNDNQFNNPEYRRVLDGLSGWQKRAWRDGDWDIAAGQFFTMFRREVHVIDEFDESRAREWFAALDYGFTGTRELPRAENIPEALFCLGRLVRARGVRPWVGDEGCELKDSCAAQGVGADLLAKPHLSA
jgi:hypothetical protein